LIIPKKKIKTMNDINQEDALLIGKIVLTAKKLAKNFNIDQSGYRLLWNTNKDAMQTVFHIHLHLIGGSMLKAI
jgi:histidine triad (HIT) family protein